jgi:hypothetical protein
LSPSRSGQGYGATDEVSADDNSPEKFGDSGDLDQLFPERLRHKKIGVSDNLFTLSIFITFGSVVIVHTRKLPLQIKYKMRRNLLVRNYIY